MAPDTPSADGDGTGDDGDRGTGTTATVLLTRHGETPWNAARRIQGWAPVGLNDRGRDQARTAAGRIDGAYDVDRVVASDLTRTRETTRILRSALGLPHDAVTFERGWRERDFGVYQGLGYDEVYEGRPEFAVGETGVASFRATPEGGESTLAARERVMDAWERLLEGLDPGETVLVVTHGGPIHVVLADVAGHDLVTELDEHSNDNCAVSEIRVVDGDPTLVRRNETGGR
ncbi:histidine phosphatase family protein [Halobacteriales archaeon QS_8_69_26]|nr:MAG: histidine phosphatase family protein [Halobacteriales archaeon QS_8_69_26]